MPESFERGALTEAVYYILLSVHKPMHGYGIMQNIEELTKGRVILGAGTLYGALNTLSERQWIVMHGEEQNKRKKEYLITELGKRVFAAELDRLQELLENAKKIEEVANYDESY